MPKWQQGETQALGIKEAMERVPLAGATQNVAGDAEDRDSATASHT